MRQNTYLTKLIDRQRAEGWSDREMSRQLGLGINGWHRIRRGERGITTHFLRHAMQRFPEYNTLALIFLSESAPDGTHDAPDGRAA